MLQEIGLPMSLPLIILEDNQGCISYGKRTVNQSSMKHIDLKYNFLKEEIKICSGYCSGGDTGHRARALLANGKPPCGLRPRSVASGSLRPGLPGDRGGAPDQRLETFSAGILVMAKAIGIESRSRDSSTFLSNE